MGQILAFYMGFAVVICYFFRKFCQDPDFIEQENEQQEGNGEFSAINPDGTPEMKDD